MKLIRPLRPCRTYAGGSHCGQYVEITRSDTGNKIKALVADSCPTCTFSPRLFFFLSWRALSFRRALR